MAYAAAKLDSTPHDYLNAGLSVLPANGPRKQPTVPWKEFQRRRPTKDEIDKWFAEQINAVCLVCGAVSGNLEVIDFDTGGEAFEPWRTLVEKYASGLRDRLVIERTPSGGYHAWYRCDIAISGNMALARRRAVVADSGEHWLYGKRYVARQNSAGQWYCDVILVETRGEGGICLCAPSLGYDLRQGEFTALPKITEEEREILLACARELNEAPVQVIDGLRPAKPHPAGALRPGDDFNARGDIRKVLLKHDWTLVREGKNEHWRRPGKNGGVSATLKEGVFFNFSSNGAPFEPNMPYSKFAVYAMLEHGSDFSAAASDLRSKGYGAPSNGHAGEAPPRHGGNCQSPPARIIRPSILSVRDLVARHPVQSEPVIDGLLRMGETMNLIAASKAGKSWLAHMLVLAVATGQPWLGRFSVTPGEVLVLDNELHSGTLAWRIPRLAEAMGIAIEVVQDRIHVDSLRGRCPDVYGLREYVKALEIGRYRLVVLDAFYRFLPRGTNENDNGAMAHCYNAIDSCAEQLQTSFALVHHATKGNQSYKSVTDVGAGAGSQSRATDTHLVLRPHQEEDVVVLEAVVRSWAPVKPVCLRWQFPLWIPDESLDPTALKAERSSHPGRARGRDGTDLPIEEVINRHFSCEPVEKTRVLAAIREKEHLSVRQANALLDRAEKQRFIHRWIVGRAHKVCYATVPKPEGRSG